MVSTVFNGDELQNLWGPVQNGNVDSLFKKQARLFLDQSQCFLICYLAPSGMRLNVSWTSALSQCIACELDPTPSQPVSWPLPGQMAEVTELGWGSWQDRNKLSPGGRTTCAMSLQSSSTFCIVPLDFTNSKIKLLTILRQWHTKPLNPIWFPFLRLEPHE